MMAKVIKSTVQVPAEVAAALKLTDFMAEARALVLEARKEAARITGEARAAAERAEQEAARRGYEEGFVRGRTDGHTEGRKSGCQEGLADSASQAGQALRCATEIAAELAAARGEILRQAREEMLDFALAVASKIVGRVAARDISTAKANLAKAMEMVSGGRRLTVKVNPQQLADLKAYCREMVETMAVKAKVNLVGDEQVGLGGVKVLSARGEIDATIDTQLARVGDALIGHPLESGPPATWRYPDGQLEAAEGVFIPVSKNEISPVMSDESV